MLRGPRYCLLSPHCPDSHRISKPCLTHTVRACIRTEPRIRQLCFRLSCLQTPGRLSTNVSRRPDVFHNPPQPLQHPQAHNNIQTQHTQDTSAPACSKSQSCTNRRSYPNSSHTGPAKCHLLPTPKRSVVCFPHILGTQTTIKHTTISYEILNPMLRFFRSLPIMTSSPLSLSPTCTILHTISHASRHIPNKKKQNPPIHLDGRVTLWDPPR